MEKRQYCPLLQKRRQTKSHYHPVSLLSIWRKFFERLAFNEMFRNNILTPSQAALKSGDSRINQLLSINHEICSSFNDGFEVKSVFLDISKAFDKVWHEGIIFKLAKHVT